MHVVRDADGTVWITRIGEGWLRVPGVAWGRFAAAVRRGDFDRFPP